MPTERSTNPNTSRGQGDDIIPTSASKKLLIIVVLLLAGLFTIVFGFTPKEFQSSLKTDNQEYVDSSQNVLSTQTDQSTPSDATEAPNEFYTVSRVVDGDTIEVTKDGKVYKIRLIGVDTPETSDPRKEIQCFGKEASVKTKELLLGRQVSLEPDETQADVDRYDRLLRYVLLVDAENSNVTSNISELLIKQGFGHEYTYDNPYKYQSEFKQAQKFAEENQLGLWNPQTCPQE